MRSTSQWRLLLFLTLPSPPSIYPLAVQPFILYTIGRTTNVQGVIFQMTENRSERVKNTSFPQLLSQITIFKETPSLGASELSSTTWMLTYGPGTIARTDKLGLAAIHRFSVSLLSLPCDKAMGDLPHHISHNRTS